MRDGAPRYSCSTRLCHFYRGMSRVSKTRTGYEINSVSMGICTFFIERFHLVEEYIKQVKKGLGYLKRKLDSSGLEHNGGNDGNFLYVNLNDQELAQNIVYQLKFSTSTKSFLIE